jgi:hypothetical protein
MKGTVQTGRVECQYKDGISFEVQVDAEVRCVHMAEWYECTHSAYNIQSPFALACILSMTMCFSFW